MTGQEHCAEAQRLLELAEGSDWTLEFTPYRDVAIAAAQVYATLAQTAATERVAIALENLPTYEGMLAIYNFGGAK